MNPKLICSIVIALCLTAVAAPALADEILVTMQGTKQGAFPGNAAGGKIVATKFSSEVVSPRDIATGQASGKRQHKPIVLTKEWGAASPQIFHALINNEVLHTVTLEFMGASPTGQREVTHFIRLTNASISDLKRYTSGGAQLEDVSLTFQTIEIQDGPNQPLVSDDW